MLPCCGQLQVPLHMLTPRALRITRYRSFTGISWLFMGFNMVPLVFVAYWNASWGDNDLTISDVEREVAARARGASDDEIAQLHATTASNRRKTRTRRTVIAYARHCRIEPLPGRASDCLTLCVCVCVFVCWYVCMCVLQVPGVSGCTHHLRQRGVGSGR